MTDDRAVSTVQTALAETRWLPVPCPTEYLPALARDVLYALELTEQWGVVTEDVFGDESPDDYADDQAHAEELAAERCQSCDHCRNALPKHVVRRLVGPWSPVVATPQEQP